jgi:hypothetical protein
MYDLNGSVFIKTNGGDNIKLSLVEIAITPIRHGDSIESAFNLYFEDYERDASLAGIRLSNLKLSFDIAKTTCKAYKKGMFEYDKVSEQIDDITKASSEAQKSILECGEDLARAINLLIDYQKKRPSIKRVTDKDGKFNIRLNKHTKYLLTTSSDRNVMGDTEKYRWIIFLNNPPSDGKIMLSNHNEINVHIRVMKDTMKDIESSIDSIND